jgi:hypothetical protein
MDDESPVHPAPEPPGDFATSAFWTSPSSWLTITSYLLPILNLLFGRDVSEVAQAAANLGPIVATAVLLYSRARAKEVVTRANLELAKLRMTKIGDPRDGFYEERIDELEAAVAKLLQEREPANAAPPRKRVART